MTSLTITPRDPIVARDGRPFSAAQRRMRSLGWPYPSVLAGSLRTLLGKLSGLPFSAEVSRELREVEVAGPLPVLAGELYFPAPADIVIQEDDHTPPARMLYAARPRDPAGAGCDLPLQGMLLGVVELLPGAVVRLVTLSPDRVVIPGLE